jgi:deuterolysin
MGMRRSVMRTGLTSENFETLAAGATYETTINAAAVHDFATGEYSFTAEGAIPYTTGNSTVLSGTAVYFKSNTLTVPVDGAKAALVTKAVNKRAKVTTPCSTAEKSATTKALANCKSLAGAASTAASSGSSSKFSEYFKSTSSSVRSTVAARLSAVASQCGSATSGITYYCEDVYGECESNVLAYTFPSTSVVVNCPLYYSALPNLTGSCHAQDQTTTTLHEFTHAPVVYSPGTQDNGYGYTAAISLSSAKAVLNADSYALYANGKCRVVA